MSKNPTNATVAHSKVILEKGSLKNSYFNKRDENHCKHIWQKSRDENMRSNISNEKTLAANPMEPVTGHWRQHIGASSEASESVIRDQPMDPLHHSTAAAHYSSLGKDKYFSAGRKIKYQDKIKRNMEKFPIRKRVRFRIDISK